VNGDWELRNVASNIEEEEIKMTVIDVEGREKRE
jgi:hypothetical protein